MSNEIQGKVSELSPEDLAALREAYIQKNIPKFTRIMTKHDATSTPSGGSFWALFFGPFWVAYRKLYRHPPALIGTAIYLFIALTSHLFLPPDMERSFARTLPFLGMLFFCFAGPYWYWKATNQEINQALTTSNGDLEKAKNILLERGGVSPLAAILTVVLFFLLVFAFGSLQEADHESYGESKRRPTISMNLPACNSPDVRMVLNEIIKQNAEDEDMDVKDWRIKSITTHPRYPSNKSAFLFCRATLDYSSSGSRYSEDFTFRVTWEDRSEGEFSVELIEGD